MSELAKKGREIFLSAIECYQSAQWAEYLDGACACDKELRGRVERLLQAHQELGAFHDDPPSSSIADVIAPERAGTVIGPYKLLAQIGEGGFGVVFSADQERPVRRRVALKVIKPGMDTREVIARFETERQALAMMDHPNIAKVFDAGTTDSGRPYFVMELVQGVPITQYCDELDLTIRKRLELFVTVCRAVQHAHQKGVIHRDIKPTNVLVTIQDDQAWPKIIDFGVAKAIHQQITDCPPETAFSQMVGTPLYMSPEQAELSPLGIDTRTDIYSLGVLLYELVTGCTPFDKDRLRTASYDEMRRIIREEEPLRPSARISTFAEDVVTTIAERRRTDPRKMRQTVLGDLDWIVTKCLEKERNRRYETASSLAEDVNRYLNNELVVARPPSPLYRVSKFVRRNKHLVATTTMLVLTVLALLGVMIFGYQNRVRELSTRLQLEQIDREKRDEEHSRREAEERARVAESERLNAQVDALIEEALRIGSGLTPDSLRAEALLTEAMEYRPEDSRLYLYRGSIRYEQGKNADAIDDLQKALQLNPENSPSAHWLIALAAKNRGDERTARRHQALAEKQDPDSVESLVIQALAMPFDERGIEWFNQAIEKSPFDPLLYFYRGRAEYNLTAAQSSKKWYDLAVSDLEKALIARPNDARIRDVLCRCYVHFYFLAAPRARPLDRAQWLIDEWLAKSPGDVRPHVILANWQLLRGEPRSAINTCRKALQASPGLYEVLGLEGWSHRSLDEFDEAIAAFSEALVRADTEQGKTDQVSILAGRAYCYAVLGQEKKARHDLDYAEQVVSRNAWRIYEWLNMIRAYEQLGDTPTALQLCNLAVAQFPECGLAYKLRGLHFEAGGETQSAINDFERAIKLTPSDHRNYVGILSCLMHHRDYGKAEFWCSKWIDVEPESNAAYRWYGLIHYRKGRYQDALADFDAALSRDPDDAKAYLYRGQTKRKLGRSQDAIADLDHVCELNPNDPEVYQARADALYSMKRYDAAARDLTEALKRLPDNARCFYLRGDCFRHLHRYDEALQDLNQAIQLEGTKAPYYDRRGLVRAALGQDELAIQDYRKALKNNPRERYVNGHLVNALSKAGESTAALQLCKAWEQLEPESSEPWCVEAELLRSMRDYQKSLDAIAQGLVRNDKEVAAYFCRGRIYLDLGQPAKALDDFDRVLKLNPSYSAVFYSRGLANERLERYQEAIGDLSRALNSGFTDPWIYYHRSESYRRLEQYKEALDDNSHFSSKTSVGVHFAQRGRILRSQGRFREALEQYQNAATSRDPPTLFARENIVFIYAAMGDLGAALDYADSWIKDDPDSHTPYRYRGFVHYLSEEYDKAIADYEQAELRDSQDFLTAYCRGQTLIAMQQEEQGRSELARSIDLCPRAQLLELHRSIGAIFGRVGDRQEAISHYSEATRIQPRDAASWRMLALMELASGDQEGFEQTVEQLFDLLGHTSNPITARMIANTAVLSELHGHDDHLLALANQSVEALPESAMAHCALGAVLFRMGKAAEALPHLMQAESLSTDLQNPADQAVLYSFLAMACQVDGNHNNARSYLERARTSDLDYSTPSFRGFDRLPKWSKLCAARLVRSEAESLLASNNTSASDHSTSSESNGNTSNHESSRGSPLTEDVETLPTGQDDVGE